MLVVRRYSSALRLLTLALICVVATLLRIPGNALVHGPLQAGIYADVSTNWAGYIYSAPGIDSIGGENAVTSFEKGGVRRRQA